MKIDLKPIKYQIGAVIPFSFDISIADVEETVPDPIKVSGEVRNRAGYLMLSMTMEGERFTVCDRCLEPISTVVSVPFEAVLADSVQDEEDDSIIVCEDDVFEPDELASSIFILELPSKNLCSEDCKGLCPSCGTNLNVSACSCCNDDIDPRLAALQKLLDDR